MYCFRAISYESHCAKSLLQIKKISLVIIKEKRKRGKDTMHRDIHQISFHSQRKYYIPKGQLL